MSLCISLSVWLAAPTLSRTLSQKIKKKICREYLHSLSLRIYSRADDSPLPFLSKKYISTSSSLSSRMSTVQKNIFKKSTTRSTQKCQVNHDAEKMIDAFSFSQLYFLTFSFLFLFLSLYFIHKQFNNIFVCP